MNRMPVRIAALVAIAGLAACGGSDVVMDELSEVEAQELASAVMLGTFESAQSIPQQPQQSSGGPQAVPYSYSVDFDGPVECPLGGIIGASGSIDMSGDSESQAVTLEYTLTQVHDGCVVAAEESERQFTLWGSPSLVLDFLVANDGEGVIEWLGSVSGKVEWATDERQGACAIAIEFSGQQEGEASLDAVVEGSVCGHAVAGELLVG